MKPLTKTQIVLALESMASAIDYGEASVTDCHMAREFAEWFYKAEAAERKKAKAEALAHG